MIVLPTLAWGSCPESDPRCQCASFTTPYHRERTSPTRHPVTVHRCPHREDRSRPWGIILQVTGNDTARQMVGARWKVCWPSITRLRRSRRSPGARYDAGLAWVHFDPGFGGLGLAAGLKHWSPKTLEAEGAPQPQCELMSVSTKQPPGPSLCRPTIQAPLAASRLHQRGGSGANSSGEPKCRFDPRASYLCRARRRRVVVNGQKVWTSLAHVARWAILSPGTTPSS